LHPTGDASPLAALRLHANTPGILGRRTLPAAPRPSRCDARLSPRAAKLPHMKTAAVIALLGATMLAASDGAAPRPIACESLTQMSVTNGRVLSAASVAAGAFTPPNSANANATASFATLPAFCRATLKLTPSSDSDINAEVWLPQSGWNHKLQASGNGGLG